MLYDKIPTDESQIPEIQAIDTDVPAEQASTRRPADGRGRVSIPKDDAFHLLQNRRRRAVCRHLLAHPDQQQFRMADLAEIVAAWENDTTVQQLTPDQRQRVYISLYQSHLPKLDTHDVIDYDKPRGLVEPTPLLAVFARFLEPELHAETRALVFEWCDEDRPSGSEESSAGGEESSAGGEESSAGGEESSAGDEESSAGGEESSAGDEESSARNDNRVRLLPKLSTLFERRSIR